MSGHTPGPWSCFVSIHGNGRTVDDCVHSDSKSAGDGDIICLSPERDGYEASAARWDDNARLIAAAPELLAQLQDVLDRIEKSDAWWMDCPDRGGFDAGAIRAVIAKATSND